MIESPEHTGSPAHKGAGKPVLIALLRWAAGFSLSLPLIWGITAVGTENIYPKAWSAEIGRNVPMPGSCFDQRVEGWARTHFGEFGLTGIKDITLSKAPKVIIWGDSFVEGFQVPDAEKMHARLTAMQSEAPPPVDAVAVGKSWWSFADYISRIPDYEQAIDGCRLHVIHLHTLEDMYPDRYAGARTSLFLSEPSLHFEKYDNEFQQIESPIHPSTVSKAASSLRIQFFLTLRTRLLRVMGMEGLRFLPGNQSEKQNGTDGVQRAWSDYLKPEWVTLETPSTAWKFALESLKGTTDLPVVFVYAPTTPTLDRGRIIRDNPENGLPGVFGQMCRESGFGFINLEESFLRFHEETGKFPHGFHRSRPWEGHYNADGHRLVAEAIHRWIKENRDAVHPD